jgi:hypothetical protein
MTTTNTIIDHVGMWPSSIDLKLPQSQSIEAKPSIGTDRKTDRQTDRQTDRSKIRHSKATSDR